MQFHTLKRKTKNPSSQLVGRGGKRGKTAGRGTKGQKARSGHKIRPELRDFIKRLPKLRGRGVNSNKSIQTKPVVIHISDLKMFKAGEIVTPKTLTDKGMLKQFGGKFPRVKILSSVGEKETVAAYNIRGCEVSATAKVEIEKAGGKIEA